MKSIALTVAVLMSTTCNLAALAETKPMSVTDRNKQAARTWFEEVVTKEKHGSIDTLVADGVVMHFPPGWKSQSTGEQKITGKAQLKQHLAGLAKKSDIGQEMVEVIGEGNKVAVLRTLSYKMGDGKAENVPWVTFFDFDEAGKITKLTHVADTHMLHKGLKPGAAKK